MELYGHSTWVSIVHVISARSLTLSDWGRSIALGPYGYTASGGNFSRKLHPDLCAHSVLGDLPEPGLQQPFVIYESSGTAAMSAAAVARTRTPRQLRCKSRSAGRLEPIRQADRKSNTQTARVLLDSGGF